jgi:hypothetical protein
LRLSVEHRAAPAIDDLYLELHQERHALELRVVDRGRDTGDAAPSLEQRIVEALSTGAQPLSQRKLRDACRVRASSLASILDDLVRRRIVRRTSTGYVLTNGASGSRIS